MGGGRTDEGRGPMTGIFTRFRADRAGTSGIEFAIIAPVMLLLFIGGITLFDIIRSYQRMIGANSVVADILSRQTSVNSAFIDKMEVFFVNLQMNKAADKALRVSSLTRSKGKFVVAWTQARGNAKLLPQEILDTSKLPDVEDGDSLLYIESAISYEPMHGILGFSGVEYFEGSAIRPRFIAAVGYGGT